jgi:hypothetical protein
MKKVAITLMLTGFIILMVIMIREYTYIDPDVKSAQAKLDSISGLRADSLLIDIIDKSDSMSNSNK